MWLERKERTAGGRDRRGEGDQLVQSLRGPSIDLSCGVLGSCWRVVLSQGVVSDLYFKITRLPC